MQSLDGQRRSLELTDPHLADHIPFVSRYPRLNVLGYLARTLFRLLVFLPLAAVGILLNIIPYQVTRLVARREEKTPQLQSTMKIFGGAFIFPIAWAVESLLAGAALGGWAALSTALLAPLTGFIAMKFNEERESFWKESLTYLRLHGGHGIWKELRVRRRKLEEEVAGLAEKYRSLLRSGAKEGKPENE